MSSRLLLALAPALLIGLSVACGDDDGGNKTIPTNSPAQSSGQDVDTKTSPKVEAPASRFAVSQDDLDAGRFITDLPHTYVISLADYAGTRAFSSLQEGETLLKQWGYVGGYETGYEPEGRLAAVLNGGFYMVEEIHLFQTEAGANAAYDHFEKKLRAGGVAQQVTTGPVGNRSSAWRQLQGKVGTSSVDAVLHHLLFRRGNLVGVLLTNGAEPFMKIDTVRNLALIVDQKALGLKTAVEPTPASNFQTPTPVSRTPTPVR